MFADGDDNQGVVLGVVFGVIALVIALVIGLGAYQLRHAQRAASAVLLVPAAGDRIPVAPALIAPAVIGPGAAAAVAGVAVEIAAVKLFFEPGQTALPAGASEALANLAQEVIAGKSLAIDTWLDPVGDATRNIEVAQQRALNVRALLASLGVPPQRIELMRPQVGGGVNARAGRVEVRAN